MPYKFNNFVLDTEKFLLLSNGKEVAIEPQVFDLIVHLIQNSDKIVSREQLLKHVWQGRVVSDTSINNNIKSARKALGDDGTKQSVIKTIHSRGYQFIAELKLIDGLNERHEPMAKRRYTWPMGVVAALVGFMVRMLYLTQGNHTETHSAAESLPSIAVLPFLNSNPKTETDYYGFAIADQVIGALNYLENITVRPSSSVRRYVSDDHDANVIGTELGVDFILTGHYLVNKSDIRLSTELVAVETNEIVWRGDPILTNYNNTFKLQDMVARQVVEGLKIEFATQKLDRIQPNIPQSPLAYEYYLRSIAYPYTTDGHRMAIEMLKQSIQLDDQYAPAYLQLGNRTRRLAQFGLVETEPLPNTEQYYLKALSLNPELLDAMAYLSMFYTESNRIDEALRLARSMYRLNPNNATTHFTLGYIYRYAGLTDQAVDAMEYAVRLDPKNIKFRSLVSTYSAAGQFQKVLDMTALYDPSPFTYGWQALMHMNLGQTEKAMQLFEFLRDNHPQSLWANIATIHLAYLMNDFGPGIKAIEALTSTAVEDGETIYYTAAYYGLLGEKRLCFQMLRKAIDAGYFNYTNMATNRYLQNYTNDREFQEILQIARNKQINFINQFFPELTAP